MGLDDRPVDAIVIGAGPNGLVAANMLADEGWDVVVMESEPDPGGAVRSGELLEPGFVTDRFSGSPALRWSGVWRRRVAACAATAQSCES